MISRSVSKVLLAQEQRFVTACGASTEYLFTTAAAINASCAAVSSGGIPGIVIDRKGIGMGALFLTAEPYAYIRTCRGSTAADKRLTLGIRLEHGDSSGGGDMAEYSTGSQPATRNFFTTAETTEYSALTTGSLSNTLNGIVSLPARYDLSGAKRFIRTIVHVGYPAKATTESTGYDPMQVGAMIAFRDADETPFDTNSTGPGSTSTSTTT